MRPQATNFIVLSTLRGILDFPLYFGPTTDTGRFRGYLHIIASKTNLVDLELEVFGEELAHEDGAVEKSRAQHAIAERR